MRELLATFDRAKVGRLLDCLNKGEAIAPPEGGWGPDDLLALAGASVASVAVSLATTHREECRGQPREHVEAVSEDVQGLASYAAQFFASLAEAVLAGRYDGAFPPVYRAALSVFEGQYSARLVDEPGGPPVPGD